MFATRFHMVATAGVVLFTSFPCSGLDLEAYDFDNLLSYSWGELRLRPQLATGFTYSDNIFYAPTESIEFVNPLNPAYLLLEVQTRPGYDFSPFEGATRQPYNGIVQFQVYSNIARTNLVALSPLFTADVYPPIKLPITGTQFGGLFGFRTNTLTLSAKTADVIGSVSPGIEIQYGAEEYNYFNGSYNVDIVRYIDLGIEPEPMHRFRFQQKFERRRLKFDGNQSVGFISSFLGAGANQGSRLVDRWNGNMLGRLTYDSSAKTDVYSELTYNFTEYQSEIPLYSDSNWQAGLGMTYKPTERIFIFAEGHYSQTTLTPSTTTLEAAPYSQVYGGFIGVRGNFTEKIQGSIRGGYEVREFPTVATADTFGIPASELALTYQPRYSTQISISYSRRTAVAAQLAQQAASYDILSVGAKQVVGTTAKWVLSADVRLRFGDFDSLISQGVVVYDYIPGSDIRYPVRRSANFQRSESSMSYNVGISYSPRPWFKSQLSYEYESYGNSFADSGFQGFFLPDYDAHRLAFSVQIGY